MLRFLSALILFALAIGGPASAAPQIPGAKPGIVRVRMVTAYGSFVLALDTRRAPKTTENFLAYVDDRRFDGMNFYRVARRKSAPKFGFIQAGIRSDARRILPPFPHERTDRTGILHLDGTISMARRDEPNSAGGNFFITVGSMPNMDARGSYQGYAAFGRVISGMPVVRKILAEPTSAAMRGTLVLRPITIVRAERLDGVAKPTGFVKPWVEVKRPIRKPPPK